MTTPTWLDKSRPSLKTARLILRPFALADAAEVQRMAGDPAVAATTATIPHPYPDGAAENWINQHEKWFEKNLAVQFAIVLQKENSLIGCIDLNCTPTHQKAELGYWIGKEHWGKGYCSEAAVAIIRYGFERMGLNKIVSRHLHINPASGKVMQKAGMKHEGTLRQEFLKDGTFCDLEVYGILRAEL